MKPKSYSSQYWKIKSTKTNLKNKSYQKFKKKGKKKKAKHRDFLTPFNFCYFIKFKNLTFL